MFSLTIVMRLSRDLPRNPLLLLLPPCCFASTLQISRNYHYDFMQRKDRNMSSLDCAVAKEKPC